MGDRLDEQPPPSSNNRSSSSSGANSPSPLESPAPVATPTPLHHTATQAQQQQSILSSTAIVNMNMAMLTQSQTTIVNNGLRNRNANVDQGLSHPSFTSGNVRLRNIVGPPSQYIKLNVGGYLHYTTVATLTKHDSMLRGMFSGRMEVLTDAEGWVLIDRCGKHFTVILNFLRDGAVALPESTRDILEILSEARYYCIQSLIDLCQAWLDLSQKNEDSLPVCRIPIITSSKEEKSLLQSTTRPTIKLLINRHNNKYSYTSQSDDNLLKNLELFDKLIMRFHERVLFIKDVGAANEVCSWTFYGHGQKVTEVCCTSIVYATDKKHTKVEFPEARIYEEAMNILLYEPETLCPSCLSLNWQQCSGSSCSSQQQQPPAVHRVLNHRQQRVIAASVADESQLSPGADHNENTNVGSGAVVAAAPSTSSGYCSDYEYRRFQQQRAKQSASKAAEI